MQGRELIALAVQDDDVGRAEVAPVDRENAALEETSAIMGLPTTTVDGDPLMLRILAWSASTVTSVSARDGVVA